MMLEARGGIEPPMKVLQTYALPLGYRALLRTVSNSLNRYRASLAGEALCPLLLAVFVAPCACP
jgi:hypothetical protein